jgi:predicted Zn finger-like uncharacterized protein
MQTRCPHCSATFDLTPLMVRTSAGRVTCSLCNTTFDIAADLASAATIHGELGNEVAAPDTTRDASERAPSSGDQPAIIATPETDLAERILTELRTRGGSPTRNSPPHRLAWLSATIAGLAVLLLQLVHHNRETLATNAHWGSALRSIYAHIGKPLPPRFDLDHYEIRDSGLTDAQSAEPGLWLHANIVNRANYAQPYPLVRVTLVDRFGTRLGRGEFAPADYLPDHTVPKAMLAPDAYAAVVLRIKDPGHEAVGFELDVCMPVEGALACASERAAERESP